MITSAASGYLVNTTQSCSIGSRTYAKRFTNPAIGVIITTNKSADYGMKRGLFLISDDPRAVFFDSDYIHFGFADKMYTDPYGVVWYYSAITYYMDESETYAGAFVDMSYAQTGVAYTDADIEALKPVKDVITAASPVIGAGSDDTIYGNKFNVDAGYSFSGDSTMYWNMFDNDINTYPDYNESTATLTQYYHKTINITSIDYAPRDSWSERLVGATIEGLTTSGTWETLHTVTSAPFQITSVPISTGHKYVATRLTCQYLNISVFNIHGSFNANEDLYSKKFKLEVFGTKSWYATALCLSELSFSTANGAVLVSGISGEYINGNETSTPIYANYTSISNLVDGDNTTECDIEWYTGSVFIITLDLTFWGGQINSYSLVTSNSYEDCDPVTWRLWNSDDGANWKLVDARTDATMPSNRRTSTTFNLPTATRTNLTYIQSDGSQFIDTGVLGDNNTDVELVFSRYMPYDYDTSSHNSWGGILSSRQYHSQDAFDVTISQGSNLIVFQYGNTAESYTATLDFGTTYTITTNSDSIYLNGILLGSNGSQTFTTPIPMTFFARNTNSEYSNMKAIEYSAIRLYSAKIYKSGILIRNYTPCRILGVAGLYDSVTDSFITSWGPYPLYGSDDAPDSTYVETDGAIFFKTPSGITSGKMKCEIDFSYSSLDNEPCVLSNTDSNGTDSGDLAVYLYNNRFDVKLFYDSSGYYYGAVEKNYFSIAPNVRLKLTIYASTYGLTAASYGRTGHNGGTGVAVDGDVFYIGCAGAPQTNGCKCRIYSVKIWDDQTLILDAAPSTQSGTLTLYDNVTHQDLEQVGGGSLLPTWYVIDGELTNIATPTPIGIVEPYPSEYWSYDSDEIVNLLNPAMIPVATPPYPYQLWLHFDDGLATGFMPVDPLIGAFAHCTLTKIEIPPSVKEIGPYAFRESKLTAVTIASDCTYYDTSFPPGCRIYTYND